MKQHMPQEILDEALENLKGNFPTWMIPREEYIRYVNDEVHVVSNDVDEWEKFCYTDECGNYICPTRFEYDKEDDEYIPVGSNIVFSNVDILHEATKLCKAEYPEIFNNLTN